MTKKDAMVKAKNLVLEALNCFNKKDVKQGNKLLNDAEAVLKTTVEGKEMCDWYDSVTKVECSFKMDTKIRFKNAKPNFTESTMGKANKAFQKLSEKEQKQLMNAMELAFKKAFDKEYQAQEAYWKGIYS